MYYNHQDREEVRKPGSAMLPGLATISENPAGIYIAPVSIPSKEVR